MIEQEIIKKISKFLGLLSFGEVDVVLEDTFKNKLGFIIDQDFFDLILLLGPELEDKIFLRLE